MYREFIVLFVSVCVSMVYSAAVIDRSAEKPAKFADQEGCYVPALKKVLPYDEPYSPQDGKSCIQYTCRSDNNTSIYSCGVIGVNNDCKLVPGDNYLPYPECCPRVQCNGIQ